MFTLLLLHLMIYVCLGSCSSHALQWVKPLGGEPAPTMVPSPLSLFFFSEVLLGGGHIKPETNVRFELRNPGLV